MTRLPSKVLTVRKRQLKAHGKAYRTDSYIYGLKNGML